MLQPKVSYIPFHLARRNMQARLWRTLLTLTGIILGVSVVLAVQITNQTTLDSLRQLFDRTIGEANLIILPANPNKQMLDIEVLSLVKDYPGVQVAAPLLSNYTLLANEASSWEISFSFSGVAAGNRFQVNGVEPELDPQVRVYTLSGGRMPAPEKYEAVIPEKFAIEKGLQIGEELVLLVPNGTERLEIVGLLRDEGVALINDGAIAFSPLNPVQEMFNRGNKLDEISLKIEQRISEDPIALENFSKELSERLGKEVQVTFPAARGQLVSQMLATYQLGLAFFSIIATFVGAFLIYNAFSMTVVERTREIGMLRAIGMNRFQILRMILSEAGILSLAGSILGIGLGILLSRGLIKLLGNLVTTTQEELNVPLMGVLQSLGVGIGVTLVAALIPSLQAAKISPLEALRARSRSRERIRPVFWIIGLVLVFIGWVMVFHLEWRHGVIFSVGYFALTCFFLGATLTVTLVINWLEGIARTFSVAIYGNEGALGSSNLRRSVGRTTLTVASLMVALTMIIGIGSVAYSFERDMANWIDHALGGDLYIRAPMPMRESFGYQLLNVPGVQIVTPSRYITVKPAPGTLYSETGVDENFYFNAIDPATYRQVADMEFAAQQGTPEDNWERLIQGKAIFISTVVADRYNLHQGDELVLLTKRGTQAFYIAAEVTDFGGQGQMIYGTYDDLRRWFSEQGVDRFTLKIAPGYSIEAVSQEIKTRYQDSHQISIQTTESFKNSILELMEQSFRLFDVLNFVGIIIGALGVINTLTMNVIERQQEIGSLRSLGMKRSQVLRLILAEALALGIIGCIYGLVVGYGMAQVMIRGVNILIGYDLVYLFTPKPYLIGALIALIIVQIAAVLPARRAANINIVESIKHE